MARKVALALRGKCKAACFHKSLLSGMHVPGAVVCHLYVSSQAKHKLQRREAITSAGAYGSQAKWNHYLMATLPGIALLLRRAAT